MLKLLFFALITKRYDASLSTIHILNWKLKVKHAFCCSNAPNTPNTPNTPSTLAHSDRSVVRMKAWQLPSNTAPKRPDLNCKARKPLFIDLWCFPFDLRGPQIRHVFAFSVYCMFSIVISIYQDRNCVVFLSVELKLVVAPCKWIFQFSSNILHIARRKRTYYKDGITEKRYKRERSPSIFICDGSARLIAHKI